MPQIEQEHKEKLLLKKLQKDQQKSKSAVQVKQSALNYDETETAVFELTDEEFIDELLSTSQLKRITNFLFRQKLNNPFVCKQVTIGLLNCIKDLPKALNSQQCEHLLPKADKDLYIQLRDRKLTFDQFAA